MLDLNDSAFELPILGCSHQIGNTKSADDGETKDTLNSGVAPSCGGTWIDSWMATGHGNGGVFVTIPSGLNGQSPSQSATAIRYCYGTPGSCRGC